MTKIILNNLDITQIYIQIILVLFLFSVIIVYPITLYPGFKIFENNIIKCKSKTLSYQNILRIVIVAVTIVVGVTSINKFDTLMALCGCVVCTPLAMIIPPIFHYKLLNKKQSRIRNIIDILVCIIGTVIALSVFVMTLINL